MKNGIDLIAEERDEQIEKHGFSVVRDLQYHEGELVQAAKFCLMYNDSVELQQFNWPEKMNAQARDVIMSKDSIDRTILAGAFMAAELDRVFYFRFLLEIAKNLSAHHGYTLPESRAVIDHNPHAFYGAYRSGITAETIADKWNTSHLGKPKSTF